MRSKLLKMVYHEVQCCHSVSSYIMTILGRLWRCIFTYLLAYLLVYSLLFKSCEDCETWLSFLSTSQTMIHITDLVIITFLSSSSSSSSVVRNARTSASEMLRRDGGQRRNCGVLDTSWSSTTWHSDSQVYAHIASLQWSRDNTKLRETARRFI